MTADALTSGRDGPPIHPDTLLQHFGLDLATAVIAKFDAVSIREGFPERLAGARVDFAPAGPHRDAVRSAAETTR
jgi:hypothetical protein